MRILERKILADFLKNRLAKTPRSAKADSQVIAPVEVEGRLYFQQLDPEKRLAELVWPVTERRSGDGKPGVGFKESGSSTPIPATGSLNVDFTVNSIKEFFFPHRQELYEQRPDGIIPRAAPEETQRLLLFPRPCDTRGLAILDRVFLGEVEDESYRRSRHNTAVVGLHCLQPDRYCFCTSLGGGPFDTEGMDLALTPLDADRYLVQEATDKGKALLASLSGKEAGEAERKAFEQFRTAAEAAIRRTIEVPDSKTMAERFDSPYWGEVSQACLTCGICSYLCPTCHCFDIVDEGYLRLRCWDTCSSDTFTRMAAGEDHRRQKRSRYRQRIYHKFSYFQENFDTHSCVGCGRCTRHCPVKIDIVEIVN
ncbi:MAG: 4Fe-4S dicluster domain-containing protein, partial [Spirochaetaceae bacterium]